MSLLSPFLCVYFLLLHGALIFELALLQLPIFSKSTYIFPPGLLRKKDLFTVFISISLRSWPIGLNITLQSKSFLKRLVRIEKERTISGNFSALFNIEYITYFVIRFIIKQISLNSLGYEKEPLAVILCHYVIYHIDKYLRNMPIRK